MAALNGWAFVGVSLGLPAGVLRARCAFAALPPEAGWQCPAARTDPPPPLPRGAAALAIAVPAVPHAAAADGPRAWHPRGQYPSGADPLCRTLAPPTARGWDSRGGGLSFRSPLPSGLSPASPFSSAPWRVEPRQGPIRVQDRSELFQVPASGSRERLHIVPTLLGALTWFRPPPACISACRTARVCCPAYPARPVWAIFIRPLGVSVSEEASALSSIRSFVIQPSWMVG